MGRESDESNEHLFRHPIRAGNLGWNQRVNDIKAAVLIVALALQILGILFVS